MRWMTLFALVPLAGCYINSDQLNEKILSQVDSDGDNYKSREFGGEDCDDTDADIHPGADEICDGVDNDCDGTIDGPDATDAATWYADTDGDGYGDNDAALEACDAPAEHVPDNTDCDDNAAEIHPAATEVCDDADNDCDGTVDEDDASDASTWYADTDGDGYGDAGTLLVSCAVPNGYLADGTDCDDSAANIHPTAEEVCDSADNNCDGDIDEDSATDAITWYADTDGDSFGDASDSTISCVSPSGHVEDSTDCNDANADISPVGTETCNGADDDCDGTVDEDDATDASTWYADTDRDGYGNPASAVVACNQPAIHVSDDRY